MPLVGSSVWKCVWLFLIFIVMCYLYGFICLGCFMYGFVLLEDGKLRNIKYDFCMYDSDYPGCT